MHSLAGLGTIQERLAAAYDFHLMHLIAAELPAEIQDSFLALRAALTPPGSQGQVRADVAGMPDEQALQHVETILAMIDSMARNEGSF